MPNKPENLPQSLFHSFENDYTKDALIAMSDSLLESATKAAFNSDALVKLPIVGGVIAIGTGILDFRERQFVSKVLRALAELDGINTEERRKFKEKLTEDPEAANKAGAVLLDLIDKTTGAEKAAMIGKVIRATIREGLSHEEMIGLCEMINKAYTSDLRALARQEGESGPSLNEVNLEGAGIKKSMRSEDVNAALEAAVDRAVSQIPVLREHAINPTGVREPVVVESGLTEAGSTLARILRDY